MKFFIFFSILSALILSCYASHHPLEKRATQVSVISYTFTNNVLAGSIKVTSIPRTRIYKPQLILTVMPKIQNIAYTKVVTVVYAVGSTWSDSQKFAAAYSSGPGSDGYETWTFSSTATGATQFYIKYDVSGTS